VIDADGQLSRGSMASLRMGLARLERHRVDVVVMRRARSRG
jgi:hypothetical protein